MRLFIIGCSLSMALAGCARVPPPLECAIQNNASLEEDPGAHFFRKDFRITITFNDPERSSIAVGDVFGAQEILTKGPYTFYEDSTSADGVPIRDPNVYAYSLSRDVPVKYESKYLINIVSGQLYYEQKIGAGVSQTFYAHCTKAEL